MSREGAPRKKAPITGLSRRDILGGIVSAGVLAAAASHSKELRAQLEEPKDEPTVPGERLTPNQEALLDLELEKAEPQTFKSGRLAGHAIGGLFVAYLGNPELEKSRTARHPRHGHHEESRHAPAVIPKELKLNYPRALHAFWERKLELLQDAGKENLNVETDAYERSMSYVRRWNNPEGYGGRDEALGRTGLLDTVKELGARTDAIKDVLTAPTGLAFFEESRHYQIRTEEQAATFAELVNRLSATMVTSYAMTELMPSDDGDFNVCFYDFLLSTAGKEFLAAIPSLGDLVESIGQYQGTHYAVRDTSADIPNWSDTRIQREGASVPNAILPSDLGIPKDIGSIYKFGDHSVMAFLYAVNIIAHTVSTLSKPHLEMLRDLDDETLVSFIAVSHNNPSGAARALDAHLRSVAIGHPVSFGECCSLKLRPYAKKTEANFSALRKAEQEYGGKNHERKIAGVIEEKQKE